MERKIKISSNNQAQSLFGLHDENIKEIGRQFKVKITLRGEYIKISGAQNNINRCEDFIAGLLDDIEAGTPPAGRHAAYAGEKEPRGRGKKPGFESSAVLPRSMRPQLVKAIGPRTQGQRDYVDAIKNHDIVFGIGPAGTGKTYLAMACAVEALKNQEVRRIILTRPAIEAGESLGYLPGDMYEKISPYLRPLYDALYDMMEPERIEKYIETGIIEVAPLAYMRGRTLNDAFIVLDEAQNSTIEQMKMFLTRLGFDSKAVITGDITQSDLPDGRPAGLLQAMDVLKGIEGIKFILFSGSDVVRHELVQQIIKAYEKNTR
ncbi:MAG: PhoH family protein [Candidatus Omnitrophica bacterium]|nr:PhoH family protein [Candidatus Omnitrophota bacterium]